MTCFNVLRGEDCILEEVGDGIRVVGILPGPAHVRSVAMAAVAPEDYDATEAGVAVQWPSLERVGDPRSEVVRALARMA